MTLDTDALRARLVAPAGRYAAVEVVASTGSTNADLVLAARAGAPDGTVRIAGQQTAGTGRRSRVWRSPSGKGLYCSVLLRPAGVPATRLGWLTLLCGVAAVELAREDAEVDAVLKWPNDLLACGGKLAGILAEAVPPHDEGDAAAVVVGIGLNVHPMPRDVPAGAGGLEPISLSGVGATLTDTGELAARLLERLAAWERRWHRARGDAAAAGLLDRYRRHCATIGSRVRVELPDEQLTGTARDVDDDGQLVVTLAGGSARTVSAGDVVHLRPA